MAPATVCWEYAVRAFPGRLDRVLVGEVHDQAKMFIGRATALSYRFQLVGGARGEDQTGTSGGQCVRQCGAYAR